MSDHVDWPSLLGAIGDTGAERVWVTHGYTNVVVRYLRDQGLDAEVLPTQWDDSDEESRPEEEEAVEA
jgi:putative mRNA 3-end processing factor